jgi:hypothetical protein
MIERVVTLQGDRWRIVRQPAQPALALAERSLVPVSVPGGLIFASVSGGRAFLPLVEALLPSEDAFEHASPEELAGWLEQALRRSL